MSSRVLKKLQSGAERSLDFITPAGEEDNQSSDDKEERKVSLSSSSKLKHLNPFDLLNQSFSESEVKEDDNETEHASAATNQNALPAASKKKKKKRKKKTRHTGNHISSEDNELIEKHLENINSATDKVSVASSTQENQNVARRELDKSLLSVELKHLNPQNEMRRTFGKRVVKIENKRGRVKHTLKTTYLVTPKENWPPVMKNVITMKPVASLETLAGIAGLEPGPSSKLLGREQWFAFEHSEYYQNIQNKFLSAVERTDSDFLINLIRRCPYHVDSLIQLSELCKMSEDYTLATELLERAILVLESALHPSFSLTSGLSRLDYRRQENRAFFIVLFKHAQYLEGRACSRTALELVKLILSFNPDDPLAVILVIDYYALRSKQFTWLIKFYEEYDPSRNLSQLPSMAYSFALALFFANGQCEEADKALQYALLMFPGVLRPLLEEMSVQTDQRVIASSYFNSEVSGNQSLSLYQLCCLYVCRAKVVWRQNQVLPWLEQNVNQVLDRIDRKDDVINEYSKRRAARYVTPPRAILRHVILADFKEKVPLGAFISKEKDPILAHDPLPPLDSINFYERKSSSSSPTTSTSRPVSMFFQSLLPSFNLNRNPANGRADAAGGIQQRILAVDAGDNVEGIRAVRPDFIAMGNAAQDMAAAINNAVQGAFGGAIGGVVNGAEGNNADGANRNDERGEIAVGYAELPNENGVALSRIDLSDSLVNMVNVLRDFLHNFELGENTQAAGGDGDAEGNNSSEDGTSD